MVANTIVQSMLLVSGCSVQIFNHIKHKHKTITSENIFSPVPSAVVPGALIKSEPNSEEES